jgi:two-component system sensor histidine kinase BaeS
MNLRISQKLMLAFVGLTMVVLLATLSLARWSFERGFYDYVNAVEKVRLEALALELAKVYQEGDGSWQTLSQTRFYSLIQNFAPPTRLRLPPSGRPMDGPRPPPIHQSGPPPGPPSRTLLLDIQENRIAGQGPLDGDSDLTEMVQLPIVIDGATVGVLYSDPRRELNDVPETAFSRQQWQAGLIIGGLALLVASILSYLLAKALSRPVSTMLTTVQQLASGNYTIDSSTAPTEKHNAINSNDELSLLNARLQRLALVLSESQTARKRLIAEISHELRTPLTILKGEIEAIKDGIRPFGPEQLESLDDETTRLHHLIEDLYQVSLSDVGGLRYQFENTDIQVLLYAAVQSIQDRAAMAHISINLQLSTEALLVYGDEQRIEQLLRNLLENALAYTDGPGEIRITARTQNGHSIIIIEDSPPSVSSEECAQLFDALYRPDASRSRRRSGAGLGLTICRNIVEAHRGEISAQPSALGGLAVTVKLPINEG